MVWLHGLVNHAQYGIMEVFQIHAIPNGGIESFHGLVDIVFAPEEPFVDVVLNSAP